MVSKKGIEPLSTDMGSLLVFTVKLFGQMVVKKGLKPLEYAERIS